MVSQLLLPNAIGCSTATPACEKAHHWEGALGLLQKMSRRRLDLGIAYGVLQEMTHRRIDFDFDFGLAHAPLLFDF